MRVIDGELLDDGVDEGGEICEGCGAPMGEGQCPLCCGKMQFEPGDEECDFCDYADACENEDNGNMEDPDR